MNREALTLWASAVATFAAGDYATTKYGLEHGAVEAHPVSAAALETAGLEGSMAAGKALVLGSAFLGWYYARSHPETAEYADLFPLLLVMAGMGIVSHNLVVIEDAATPP